MIAQHQQQQYQQHIKSQYSQQLAQARSHEMLTPRPDEQLYYQAGYTGSPQRNVGRFVQMQNRDGNFVGVQQHIQVIFVYFALFSVIILIFST